MKIKELTNAPKWLMDAIVEDEDVTIDGNGRVIWNSGQWHRGDFRGGNFLGGNFLGGNFLGGDFWGGDFLGGNFRGGDFWGGDFRGGNFRGGNFLGGNFLGGNFWGGDFRGGDFLGEKITQKPLSIYGMHWDVMISDSRMMIGCQMHAHDEWASFDDATICAMDRQALRFWREHGPALLLMCKAHAAKAKKVEEKAA